MFVPPSRRYRGAWTLYFWVGLSAWLMIPLVPVAIVLLVVASIFAGKLRRSVWALIEDCADSGASATGAQAATSPAATWLASADVTLATALNRHCDTLGLSGGRASRGLPVTAMCLNITFSLVLVASMVVLVNVYQPDRRLDDNLVSAVIGFGLLGLSLLGLAAARIFTWVVTRQAADIADRIANARGAGAVATAPAAAQPHA